MRGLEYRIHELAALSHHWTGDEAMSPSPGVLDSMETFLGQLESEFIKARHALSLPELNPCSDGSVDVVWRLKQTHIMLNFTPDQPLHPKFYIDGYDFTEGVSGSIDIHDQRSWSAVVTALRDRHGAIDAL